MRFEVKMYPWRIRSLKDTCFEYGINIFIITHEIAPPVYSSTLNLAVFLEDDKECCFFRKHKRYCITKNKAFQQVTLPGALLKSYDSLLLCSENFVQSGFGLKENLNNEVENLFAWWVLTPWSLHKWTVFCRICRTTLLLSARNVISLITIDFKNFISNTIIINTIVIIHHKIIE